jgi:hypothetical protein
MPRLKEVRAGQPGVDPPRRDRGDEPRAPGQDPPRAAGRRVHPARGTPARPGGRQGDGVDQPPARPGRGGRQLPRGPLLPIERHPPGAAAATGAGGGHSHTQPALRAPLRGALPELAA